MPEDLEKANMLYFANQAKKGKLKMNIDELDGKKESQSYNKYIGNIIAANPKEYFVDSSSNIKTDDFTKLSVIFIYEIFGEKYLKDYIELLDNKRVIANGSRSILDGANIIIGSINDPTFRESAISIPEVSHVSSIINLVHEFAHYLCDKYNYNFNKKFYYGEILSIYAEKRALEFANKIFNNKDFNQILEETRIEGIKWHYTEQKQTLEYLKFIYNSSLINASNNFDIKAINPLLASPKDAIYVFKFYEQFAASYGIGYLYSESLISKRKDDSATVDKFIDKTIRGEKSLDELLKYFNISMFNNDVFETANQKIKSIATKK